MQMTMDTAGIVGDMIVNRGIPLESIKFIDRPVLKLNKHERVKMNFRYLADIKQFGKKPLICDKVLKIIKNTNEFDIDFLE